ncbi:hypothetical protein EBH_0057120 [Eimeria brunetti]|uniref:Integrase catalytic domain-containing protein n=1 Tax=Eimeria brunetti TaxID=51314 RepID=U6LVD5_9EIME|nr:hypothetical protein EBH_0057120 [Eimeria brunetti]
MMAPKLPAAGMQPPERQTEDVEQYKRIIEELSPSLLQATTLQPNPAPVASTPRESSENMEYFGGRMERRFTSMSLSQDLWGHELGDYLDRIALQCYSDLVRTGTGMTDWSYVKRELLKGFCSVDRATVVPQMADNKWTGDYRTCTANFCRITANGAQLPANELVSYILTNTPDELGWAVTKRGRKYFSNWREASEALAAIAGPWGASQEEFRRRQQELRLSRAAGDAKNPLAAGPNPIPVSPRWAEKLFPEEQREPEDEQGTTACRNLSAAGRTEAHAPSGREEEARDADSSREVHDEVSLEDTNGAQLRIDRVVENLTAWCGSECFTGDYLVGPVPCEIVLGFDRLKKHRVAWHFQSDKLSTYLNDQWRELPLVHSRRDERIAKGHQVPPKRTPAEEAYDLLARLNLVLALPEVDNSVAQRLRPSGRLCCAFTSPDNRRAEEAHPSPSVDTTHGSDDEDSPWHIAKLEFTLFGTWMQSPSFQDLPQEIREVLGAHRQVFPDNLPLGLPPKRPHGHHILLAPGKVLSILLTHKFYPKFRKCQLARQEFTYLGYTMTPDMPLVAYSNKPAIGFLSQAMTPVQHKCSICDQELLALVTALDMRSHLLRVGKVSNHQALTHLQKLQMSKTLRGRTPRWFDFLAEFPDLTIIYLQGARNTVADALSRLSCHSSSQPPPPSTPPQLPHSEPLAPLMLASAHPDTAHHTGGKQVNYRRLAGIRRGTPRPHPQSPPVMPKADQFTPDDTAPSTASPVQTTCSETLECPAAYAKCSVFRDPYNTAVQADGATVQVEFRHRLFAFRFVTPFLNVCIHGLWRLLIPSRRWSHLSLDFTTDLPPTKTGHDSILVLVNSHSKMAHFVPVKKTFTKADTVDVLAYRLIRYYGLPEALISDRDHRFNSALWQQLCGPFHIQPAISSSYDPQSDGQTERVNRKLEQLPRTYIQSEEREWERLLPALELAYNTTNHSSTEPFPLIGEKPLTAADLDVVGALSSTLRLPMTKLFRQLCDPAQSHILKAKIQQKH